MFDKEKFIQCIEEHPSIWNKNYKGYNDRKIRENSWYAVGEVMFDQWDEMLDDERQEQVKEMKSKWRHMRDCFGKYVNQGKNGDSTLKRKKYVYADLLSFLHQTLNSKPTSEDTSQQAQEDFDCDPQLFYVHEESSGTDDEVKEIVIPTSTKAPVSKKPLLRKSQTFVEEKPPKKFISRSAEEEDPDRSFLISILGDVKKLNDEEKLDFRFHTLQFFRDIQRKRKFAQSSQPDQFSD